MQQVEDICKPDMYWNTAHPGVGVSASSSGVNNGHEKDEEGWELMYVRLRGKARFAGP